MSSKSNKSLKRKWEGLMFPKKKVRVPVVNSKQLAVAVRRQIAKVAEHKEITTANNPSTVPATNGTVVLLNSIAEGTDINQRVGRHITLGSLDCSIQVLGPTSTTLTYMDFIYVALVYDKQPDGSTPTFATIFDTSGSTYSNLFLNTAQYADRFKILWEERSIVQNQANGSSGLAGSNFQNVYYRKYHKFPVDMKCEFSGSGASTPTTGAVYLVFSSADNTGVAASSGAVGYTCKLKYTDM